MQNRKLLLSTLSDFARTLVADYDVDLALTDLTATLTDLLDLAGTGVTLADGDRLRYATALPPEIIALEKLQESRQMGPSVEAFRSGEVVAVPDLTQTSRWPELTAAAAEVGVGAIVGIPMTLGERTIGALDVYSSRPRDWDEEEIATAVLLADMATVYLVNAAAHTHQSQLTEQLQAALDSRVVVEQAKGVVAAQRGVGVEEAFSLLRSHARHHRASLRGVAEAVVGMGLRI